MLKRLACEHSLAFAIGFDTSILPYRYEFIVALDSKRSPQNQPERESIFHECVLAFADDISRSLPMSMYFVFHAIEPREHCAKRFSSAFKLSQKPFVPSVPEIAELLACFMQENPKADSNRDSTKWSKLYKRFFSQVLGTLDSHIQPTQITSNKQGKKPAHTSSAAPSLHVIGYHDLYATIRALFQLLQQRPITIATPIGSYTLSRTPMISSALQTSRAAQSTAESTAVFWDTNALQTFMRVDSLQVSFLASIEKPSMRLCPKEIFREQFFPKSPPGEMSASRTAACSSVEIPCQLAFDPMLMLFGAVAREMSETEGLAEGLESGLEYVFLTKTSSKTLDFIYGLHCLASAPKLIVCGGDGVYIEEKRSLHDLPAIIKRHYPACNLAPESTQPLESKHASRQNLLDFKSPDSYAKDSPSISNPHNPNARQMLVCYLSTSHQSAIWSYNGAQFFELLPIHFNASEAYMLSQLEQHYQGADRLIANYRKHFGDDALDFCAHPASQNLDSRNLIDMLAIIARTLGYCKKESATPSAIYSLLDSAKLCLRDKGPRIDYKLKKLDSGALDLDYPRILRSCMSFALAGVEKELIAYGVLDSLAEFMGGFVRDVVQNYAMKQVFLCGDMLSHKVFLDKILLYLPRDITLILPQDGWVDSK